MAMVCHGHTLGAIRHPRLVIVASSGTDRRSFLAGGPWTALRGQRGSLCVRLYCARWDLCTHCGPANRRASAPGSFRVTRLLWYFVRLRSTEADLQPGGRTTGLLFPNWVSGQRKGVTGCRSPRCREDVGCSPSSPACQASRLCGRRRRASLRRPAAACGGHPA
jgi:hypothetical protein